MTGPNYPPYGQQPIQHPVQASAAPWRLPPPPHWPPSDSTAGTPYGHRPPIAVLSSAGRSGLAPGFLRLWKLGKDAGYEAAGRRMGLDATSNQYGTTLNPDKGRLKALQIAYGILTAVTIGWALLLLLGVHLPSLAAPRRHAASSAFAVYEALMVASLGIGTGALVLMRRRRWNRNHLTISPGGVCLNGTTVRAARWEDIADVIDFVPWMDRAEAATREPLTARNIVLVLKDRSLKIIRNPEVFAPNPPALFWMIRNYWLHPEQRTELTNGIALNRLAREDFPYT